MWSGRVSAGMSPIVWFCLPALSEQVLGCFPLFSARVGRAGVSFCKRWPVVSLRASVEISYFVVCCDCLLCFAVVAQVTLICLLCLFRCSVVQKIFTLAYSTNAIFTPQLPQQKPALCQGEGALSLRAMSRKRVTNSHGDGARAFPRAL